MRVLSVLALACIYIILAVKYLQMMASREEEEEPMIEYSNSLHELIVSLYETDSQIQLVQEMAINIDTADSIVQGDALRSMDIYWDWCGKLEQNTSIPICKGTATAEAFRNLAMVRREELLLKLSRQIAELPSPDKKKNP